MPSEYILKLKDGDHQVFKEIYTDWNRRVYYYYLKKTDNEDVSKELTQQVFIKLWKYRDSLSTAFTIDQQLFQKARLIYIDWLRAEATKRKYFAAGPAAADEIAALATEPALDERQHIETSLRTLSPKRRKIFELKHIHGYSYKEIAAFLGITVKTVDNHLLKATSHLKKVLNL